MSPDLAIPAPPAALRNEGSGFLPLTAKAASFSGIGYASGNGETLCMGQFQGGFALCTVKGGEFLDENFQRPPGGLLAAAEPKTAHLRLVSPSLTGISEVTLESRREDNTLIETGVPLAVTRVGRSSVYVGTFQFVPDGYLGSIPPGTVVHVAIADGNLNAHEVEGGASSRASMLRSNGYPPGHGTDLPQQLAASTGPVMAHTPSLGLVKGRIASVGFAGDQKISRYPNAADIIDPDDTAAVWLATEPTSDSVCYALDTQPELFGSVLVTSVNGQNLAGLKADIEVRRPGTGQVLGTKLGIELSGGEVRFDGLTLTSGNPAGVKVASTEYEWWLRVYLSKPRTGSWQRLDNMSGPHKIFWTYGIAKDPPFRSAGLFDRALDRACAAAQGETDLMEVLRLITNKVKSDITYDPGAEPSGGHPLGLYDYGGSYCAENSQLLRGLFRSIGVDAEVRYIWNGTKGHLEQMYFYRTARTMFAPNGEERGFQVGMAQEDEVPPDPHFKFHAVVDANGTSFDPSYGTSGFASLDFLEAVGVVEPYQLLVGAAANQNQNSRVDSYPPEPALQTGVRCSHSD